MFTRPTGRRDDRTTPRRPRSAALGLESLEGRRLMNASAMLDGAILRIQGTAEADVVEVKTGGREGVFQVVMSTRSNPNSLTTRTFGGSQFSTILFSGEEGDDTFTNSTTLTSTAYGGIGNDNLMGGSARDDLQGGFGEDRLIGNGGDDLLRGGDDDDVLYGNSGLDRLDGGRGRDFLDAGSVDGESVIGDSEDFHAFFPVVTGTAATDVRQGTSRAGRFLAALQGVAGNGVNLASRIRYLGDGTYEVNLFSAPRTTQSTLVRFEGDVTTRDPRTAGGEFWTVLYQRAYARLMGRETGTAGEAMLALTGLPAGSSTLLNLDLFDQNFDAIRTAIGNRKAVVADSGGTLVSHPMILDNHAYTVTSAFVSNGVKFVRLRNPFGIDGAVPSGDADDGIVTLRFSDFKLCFGSIWIEG